MLRISQARVEQITKQFVRGMIAAAARFTMLLQLNGVLPVKNWAWFANQDPKESIVMMMDSRPVVISRSFSQLAGT